MKNNWHGHHIRILLRTQIDMSKDIGVHSHCYIVTYTLIGTETDVLIPVHATLQEQRKTTILLGYGAIVLYAN
jgi:hypothetical protein